MSGHSKWSQIKHKKAVIDAKKGKIFGKLSKIITIAAQNGQDPEKNPTLRVALEQAKAVNMPKPNIERAIKKASGEKDENKLEEVVYEAYGPNGVPLLITVITNNKNRALSEIRHILTKHNGKLGESGSVIWMFQKRGVIITNANDSGSIEELELELIDAGAEDIKKDGNQLKITAELDKIGSIKDLLNQKNIAIESADIAWIPKDKAPPNNTEALNSVNKIIEELLNQEDVENVYHNLN